MKVFITLFMLLVSLPAGAGIYKWTDAEGKVHFGDQPKDQGVQAEEIEVKDYKPGTDDAVREVYQRRDRLLDAGREDGRAKAEADRAAARRDELARRECAAAREEYAKISNPVVFVDSAGKPVKVSERERAARATAIESWIKDNCR